MHSRPRTLSRDFLSHLVVAAILLLSAQVLFANTNPFPLTITDSRGVAITVEAPPNRVVSLSPSLTEILFAVDAGKAVNGVTTYCNYPEEALGIDQIGGFSAKTISIEKIVSLEPDLVFADNSRHGSVIESLENYGIAVISTNATSIEDCYHIIEMVGAATGNRDSALSLISDMMTRIAKVTEITNKIPREKRPRVFWEVFDEPLMTAGPSTFIGQLIDLAGGSNIFSDVAESWPQISHEVLLARDPEVLMSSDSHGDKFTADQIETRTGWQSLSAVRNGMIYLFDGDMVSRPGPRMVDSLEAIAAALYPDLFR
jgi:iron complex transport system substrate-binding protein